MFTGEDRRYIKMRFDRLEKVLSAILKEASKKETEIMSRLDQMNEKIAAFQAAQDAENAAIEQVKAAIDALKNAPAGDPDAAAAADAALAAWDAATSGTAEQATELASVATQALHGRGG